MYEADFNGREKTRATKTGSFDYTGETDRTSGEFHYKSGYTQRIYSDAHYIPSDDATAPPRHYSASHVAETKAYSPKTKNRYGILVVLAMCIACLAFGTAVGAFRTGSQLRARVELLENALQEKEAKGMLMASDALVWEDSAVPAEAMVAGENGRNARMTADGFYGLTPSDIYELACRQTVGISTEVTYSNFFGRTSSQAVSGSGFILSEDGFILTNYHVIEYAYDYGYEVTVMMHDGTRYVAEIVGVEESNDIAVLKISAMDLKPVTFADSGTLRVGDDIFAVGNPLGELEFSMTCGHVSALDRLISTDTTENGINMFQIDAAVNTGNSGGPLFDRNGCVVGVVTAKYSSSGVEGIGFAIPSNDALEIANDLITYGYVTGKASLSLTLDERYTTVYSQYYGLPQGAYVYSVDDGGCAENAGLQSGDIILRIGQAEIGGASKVQSVLRNYKAGDTVTITYYRAGTENTVSVRLDEAVPKGFH